MYAESRQGQKGELRTWCRLNGTTLVTSVLTAYVALVLRWCNVSEVVIPYTTDGRVNHKIAHTMGYFASTLYLHITLLEGDHFVDLMKTVTKAYCTAFEHADASYLATRASRPDFMRNPSFNWVSQATTHEMADSFGAGQTLEGSPIPFEHPMLKHLTLDNEPGILLYDGEDDITGTVSFPLNRFVQFEMENFAHNVLRLIETLIKQPTRRVDDVSPRWASLKCRI
jgi:non-ribosomal peptide synthetase component F